MNSYANTVNYCILEHGFKLNILSRSENVTGLYGQHDVKVFTGDIRDADLVKKSLDGVDYVIHLAGTMDVYYDECAKNKEWSKAVNTDGARLVLNCLQPNQKFIFSSTNTVYGEQQKNSMINEDSECHPIRYYSLSKLMVERDVISHGHVVLRFPNVIGVSDKVHENSLVSNFICEALSQKTTVKIIIFR